MNSHWLFLQGQAWLYERLPGVPTVRGALDFRLLGVSGWGAQTGALAGEGI